jgi:O-antigen/teichoic acid export membrane protein
MEEGRLRSYFAHAASLVGASVVSQAVSFVGVLVIARLYGPDDVGLFALFVAVWGIASVAASWRYELAIVTVDDEDRAGDVALFVVHAAVLSAIVAAIVLAAIEFIPGTLGLSLAFRRELMFIVPGLVATGLVFAGTNVCVRERRFKRVAVQQVVGTVITVGGQIALVGTDVPGGGLVTGFFLGQVASAIVLAPPLVPRLVGRFFHPALSRRLWHEAREHRGYFFYTVPYSLLTQLYFQVPVMFLAGHAGTKAVGFFNLAFRTTTTPFGFVPIAIAQVLFPDMARDRHQMAAWGPRIHAVLVGLGLLFAPAVAAILAFGPDIYTLLLGERWRDTGLYAALLVVPNLMSMLCSGYDRLYFMLDRQRVAFILTVFACALSAGTMIGANHISDAPAWLVGGWAAFHFIYAFVWMATLYRVAGFSIPKLVIAWSAILSAVAVLTAIGYAPPVRRGDAWAIAAVLLVLAVYGLIALRTIAPLKQLVRRRG